MGGREFSLEVAGTIMKQLEQGTAPWTRSRAPGERYLPYSPSTGKSYQGINGVWLMAAGQEMGYTDPRWLTPGQAGALGAHVRPGEKGTAIEFWRWDAERLLLGQGGNPVLDETGRPKRERVRLEVPQLFQAVVFNAVQLEGLPPLEKLTPPSEEQRHERVTALLEASGAQIRHAGDARGHYSPRADLIVLPEPEPSDRAARYHIEALHELGHWTGHRSRLGRSLEHPPGSAGYAREELRAGIASLLLGQELGVGHDPGHHAAYAGAWIQLLRKDPHELFRAAADAGKILLFVRGIEQRRDRATQAEQPREQSGAASLDRSAMPILVASPIGASLAEGCSRLAVPYEEKDEARSLGASWDPDARLWQAPEGAKLDGLERWSPEKQLLRPALVDGPRTDPRVEFSAALREAGLELEGLPEMDGMLRRVKARGDGRGELSGTYVGYLDAHPGGRVENRRTGARIDWNSSVPSKALGPEDRSRLSAEAAERQAERSDAQERRFERTAMEAAARWAVSRPVEKQEHPYLAASDVSAHGLRQDEQGDLLVPLRDTSGKLWSLQAITPDGTEKVAENSRLTGVFCAIGPVGKRTLLVAEGYAAAATLLEATGHAAVAVTGSANLEPTVRALREKYPDKRIFVAAERWMENQVVSISHRNAEKAAHAAGGEVLAPRWNGREVTSWQDLASTAGLQEVAAQVRAGIARAERRELAAGREQSRAALRGVLTEAREMAGLGR